VCYVGIKQLNLNISFLTTPQTFNMMHSTIIAFMTFLICLDT
jgi:hypothetical protein